MNASTGENRPQEAAGEPVASVTILLVEDDENLRRITAMPLKRAGFNVLSAANAVTAEEMARAVPIDLLVTDLTLPGGVTGKDLADSLRARFSNLRVLYVSGHTPELARTEFNLEANCRFLRKPFMMQTLVDAVRGCLEP